MGSWRGTGREGGRGRRRGEREIREIEEGGGGRVRERREMEGGERGKDGRKELYSPHLLLLQQTRHLRKIEGGGGEMGSQLTDIPQQAIKTLLAGIYLLMDNT